jgi:hypothetical protein
MPAPPETKVFWDVTFRPNGSVRAIYFYVRKPGSETVLIQITDDELKMALDPVTGDIRNKSAILAKAKAKYLDKITYGPARADAERDAEETRMAKKSRIHFTFPEGAF